MNEVTGRVVLRSSGAGVADLVVTVYDLRSGSIGPSPLEAWDELDGDRLGSVLTDADGAFVLEYDDADLDGRRPALLLFVTAPEGLHATGCSPMLHVSCGIRQNAGRRESYLIALSTEDLQRAGLLPPPDAAPVPPDGAPVPPAKHPDRRSHTHHAVVEKVRKHWLQAEAPAPRVSEIYRQRLRTARSTAGPDGPAKGFRLSLPVRSAPVAFDAETKRWFMRDASEPTEMHFAGVVNHEHVAHSETAARGLDVMVDAENHEFHLVVSAAPVRLRAEEHTPGDLFTHLFRQRLRTLKDRT